MKKIIFIVSASLLLSADVTESYTVEGMHCGFGCANKVKSIINSIEGVKTCDVNFEKSLLTVEFDEEKVNTDLIISSLSKQTTYRTSKIKDKTKDSDKKSFWNRLKGVFSKKS